MDYIHDRPWLGHTLMSVPLFFVFMGIAILAHLQPAPLAAALGVVVWWWSREKTDHEHMLAAISLFGKRGAWFKGFFPWEWEFDAILGVVFPAIVVLALGLFLSYVR